MVNGDAKIKFIYIKPSIDPVYINGANSAITDSGEVILNLYFERRPIPSEKIYELCEDGSIGNETEEEQGPLVVERNIKVSVILTLENAKSLSELILKTVNKEDEPKKAEEQTKLS